MRRVPVLAFGLSIVTGAAAACVGSDPGGTTAPPTSGADAGSDTDGTPADAAADAAGDATPADGGIDANDTFCAREPPHALCADFDSVNDVMDGWPESGFDYDGGIALRYATYVSSPRSMLASTPAIVAFADPSVTAWLARAVAVKPNRRAVARFSIEPVVIAPIDSATTSWIDVLNVSLDAKSAVLLGYDKDGWHVLSYDPSWAPPSPRFALSGTPPLVPGKWTRLELDVLFTTASTGYVKLTELDDNGAVKQVLVNETNRQTTMIANPTTITLAPGIAGHGGPLPAFQMAFDNLTLDVE